MREMVGIFDDPNPWLCFLHTTTPLTHLLYVLDSGTLWNYKFSEFAYHKLEKFLERYSNWIRSATTYRFTVISETYR